MNETQAMSNAYDGKHDEYGHGLPRWMNFERAVDAGEMGPNQTATDYYGFELPNGVAMVIQSQPSHRDHPFIVYSYGDEACFHDDVEFDSLRTAIDYASQLHSGAIDPDCLRVEYALDEYGTLCWRDFYQAAHGNIEYASRLIDQCDGGFREGFSPYACAAEDLAEGEIVDFNNCYVITDANGPDAKEIAAKRIWDELGDVCIDDNECIDSEFHGYPIGTFREDIWHDIEDQLGVPIHELMFPDDAQLKDGKIEVNFYNHESKEAHTIPVNPFAASKANKAAREAFFERKDAEREHGKGLGAKAASARGASEKLDGQSQTSPAKDNLEH